MYIVLHDSCLVDWWPSVVGVTVLGTKSKEIERPWASREAWRRGKGGMAARKRGHGGEEKGAGSPGKAYHSHVADVTAGHLSYG